MSNNTYNLLKEINNVNFNNAKFIENLSNFTTLIMIFLFLEKNSYCLISIYRSPCSNSEEFLSSICQYLSDMTPSSNHIICGFIILY